MNTQAAAGVSPAYFISYFDFNFRAPDAAARLPEIASLGFGGVQGEIPRRDYVDEWVDHGAALFGKTARDAGLEVRQMVLHYLVDHQRSDRWTDSIDTAVIVRISEAIARWIPECTTLTIPIGRDTVSSGDAMSSFASFADDLVSRMPAAIRLAFEALPGSSLIYPAMTRRFLESTRSSRIGVVLDTGSLWSTGNAPESLVAAIGAERIFGTHLCDNFGVENESLAPGDGSIDWPTLFNVLGEAEYAGPFDIEIRTSVETVVPMYSTALRYITAVMKHHYHPTQGGRSCFPTH